MRIALALTTAAIVTAVALSPAAAAAPRPLICQLLDLGLKPGAIMAALAVQDGAAWGGKPYPGTYGEIYFGTIDQRCPEYCDGIEVACR